MAIRIWHRQHSLFGIVPQTMDLAQFTCIAELATDDPEQAFHWSQHDEQDWQRHPTRVIQAFDAYPRSTSVGDILEQRATGTCFLVLAQGFKELPDCQFPEQPPGA